MVHLKRALKVCTTLAALALSLWFVSLGFMWRHETYDKYKTFMESKTDYDVVFLGSSHVRLTVNPMQLWNDYGIISYNLGSDAAYFMIDYWVIQIAQSYNKPKIAMIDIFRLWQELSPLPAAHSALDTFPLFPTKWRVALDLCTTLEERIEIVFPLYLYHNRWKENNFHFNIKNTIKRFLGKYKPHIARGMDFRINIKDKNSFNTETKIQYTGTENSSIKYCRKIIAWCKKNDIVPVFMNIPYSSAVKPPSKENLETWILALRKILEQEDVLFLDMTDGFVDFDIDQADQDSHLNPSGARKVTDAIGAFLSETLGCQSHKDDPAFAAWHDDYDAYRQWLLGTIARQGDFKNLLMMANHAEVYAAVRAGNNAAFDAVEEKLLFENWSDIRFERTGAEDAAVTVTVFERGTDREVVTRRFEKR